MSLAFSIGAKREQLNVAPAAVVKQHTDRCGIAAGSQALFVGTGRDATEFVVTVRTEDKIFDLAVRTEL